MVRSEKKIFLALGSALPGFFCEIFPRPSHHNCNDETRRVSEDEIKVIYIGNYEWINSTAGY